MNCGAFVMLVSVCLLSCRTAQGAACSCTASMNDKHIFCGCLRPLWPCQEALSGTVLLCFCNQEDKLKVPMSPCSVIMHEHVLLPHDAHVPVVG
jgi:hypothetical protein